MNAKIKAGKNWQMLHGKSQDITIPVEGFVMSTNQGASFENQALGACVQVKTDAQKVQIPAPFGIKPENATGEGVTVSQLKDEEGGAPQEFLNISQKGAWLSFFGDAESDYLKITVK